MGGGGGWSSHLGRPDTLCGPKPGGVLHLLWSPGLTVPGVATGCIKRPHWDILEDWVVGQQVKLKTMTCQTGGILFGMSEEAFGWISRGVGIKIPGKSEDKSAMPRLRGVDDGGIHDSPPPVTTCNRAIYLLVQDNGDPTRAYPSSL